MADDEKKEPTEKDDTEKPTRHKRDRKEVADVVDRLVSRYGSERAALAVLADENLDFRESIRDIKTKVPAEGTRVLNADEAKELDAFKALGKPPKDIATAMTERDAFATENGELKSEKVTAEAARLIGSEKPAVLSRVLKAEGYRLEIRDEKDGDEVRRVAYAVKGDGDKPEATELGELLSSSLSDYKPALLTEQSAPRATGAPIPPQPPKGTAPAPKEKSLEQLKAEKRATGAYSA